MLARAGGWFKPARLKFAAASNSALDSLGIPGRLAPCATCAAVAQERLSLMGANQSASSADETAESCRQAGLITHLPDDALCRCLATVPFRDRAVIVRVCKSWRNTVASRAFAVARRELAEPLWLVIGGQNHDNFNDYVAEAMSNQCRIFDASLQPVARLKSLPRPL